MSLHELIQKRRTIRRFKQIPLDEDILRRIVDCARLAPSAMNLQPLEYLIIDDPVKVAQVFPLVRWAGYLPKEQGVPPPGQEPVAYIFVLINKALAKGWERHDVGAAVQNMILCALEHGIGACWLGSLNKEEACRMFHIPAQYEADSALALGYPDEEPVVVPLQDSVKYFKDETGRLHVPKRALETVAHYNHF